MPQLTWLDPDILDFPPAEQALDDLFTYNLADPGWTRSGDVTDVQNAGGRMGAWIADVLLLVLGYLAYLFPVIVAVKVWQMFRKRHLPFIWNGWLFSWRLIGFFLTVFSGCALAALHGTPPAGFPEGAGAGGVLGQLLRDLAYPALNMQARVGEIVGEERHYQVKTDGNHGQQRALAQPQAELLSPGEMSR